MKKKRITGIILIIIGIALYLVSNYINEQVAEGRVKISSAQKEVDVGSKLFSMSPYTEGAGTFAKGHAQKKINEGEQTANQYERTAKWLFSLGIISGLIGIFLVIWSFKKRLK